MQPKKERQVLHNRQVHQEPPQPHVQVQHHQEPLQLHVHVQHQQQKEDFSVQ